MDKFEIDGIEELDKTLNKIATMKTTIIQKIVKTLSTIRNEIIKRTTSGISVNGTRFKGYSERYKIIRSANHRQTSPVSLTWTGNMLRAMKTTNIKNGGEIKFADTEANDLAVKHNEGKGVPKREFFGLNKENMDYLEKNVGKVIPL